MLKIYWVFLLFLVVLIIPFGDGHAAIAQNDQETTALTDTIDVLDFNELEVTDVLRLISQKVNRNIAASQNVKGRVTIYLKNVSTWEAFKVIADSYGWAFVEEENVIRVMTAQEYEDKFGKKFGQSLKTRMYDLKFSSASGVAVLLTQMKSPSGKVLTDDKSSTVIVIDSPDKLLEMDQIIQQLDTPTKTEVFKLSYAKAKDLSPEISQILTPSLGIIKFDERSNRIIVTDTPRIIEKVKDLITAFDSKHKEVMIQAKIVQVILDDSHKMGVDWTAIVSKFNDMTFKSNFNVLSATDKRGNITVGTLSDDDFSAMIEALNSVGDTNILSSPRIIALNNEEAKILVGSTEPYVTTTTTTSSSGPSITAESVNFIDVGVKLYVTPTIHEDGFITIKIKPEVSTKTGDLPTNNNNSIPIIDTSEAETKVMVKNGVTIVLGGLIKEEIIKRENSVPFLGKIPILGTAFRSQSNTKTKTEIAIFIKPTIISGDINEPLMSGQQ